MADPSYRSRFHDLMPTVLRGYWGERFTDTIFLLFDLLQQGASDAVRAPLIGAVGGGPALDALVPAGEELSLPQYPGEPNANYLARIDRAWQDWEFAGDETTMLAQLATAGWPDALIFTPHEWPTVAPIGYWSQFWLFWPAGTHPVTDVAPTWGAFTYGDGTVWGIGGVTASEMALVRGIVKKWKPAHWICRGMEFVLDGFAYGDGHHWGDTDLLWGGSAIVLVTF